MIQQFQHMATYTNELKSESHRTGIAQRAKFTCDAYRCPKLNPSSELGLKTAKSDVPPLTPT